MTSANFMEKTIYSSIFMRRTFSLFCLNFLSVGVFICLMLSAEQKRRLKSFLRRQDITFNIKLTFNGKFEKKKSKNKSSCKYFFLHLSSTISFHCLLFLITLKLIKLDFLVTMSDLNDLLFKTPEVIE